MLLDLYFIDNKPSQNDTTPPYLPRSRITQYERYRDRTNRQYVHYLKAQAAHLHKRVQSWSNPTNLFETGNFLVLHHDFREYYHKLMGTKRKTNTTETIKPDWKGFIEYRLSEDELAALDAWQPEPHEIWEAVELMLSAGYVLKLSYNTERHEGYCTVVDQNPRGKTSGWAVGNTDTNGLLALKMAVYKHFQVFKDGWPIPNGDGPKTRRG